MCSSDLLALSVVVSLFGIVNTLVLTVYERTREIGMLRAIGMTRRQVRQMIRLESVITAMIGAVVGSQPFGGEGLSGTGPKAGGPHYLHRFCLERHVSIDTTSAGGNATLLSLDEGDIGTHIG